MPSLQPPFSPEHLAAVKQYRKIEDLLPSHWSESEVSANGLRHHYYRTGGEKPQLVLLHGFQESAICWLRVAKVLEQDYDLLLIDARGHGLSDRAGPAFTPQLLTEDAAGVIQALKLDRPHLLALIWISSCWATNSGHGPGSSMRRRGSCKRASRAPSCCCTANTSRRLARL